MTMKIRKILPLFLCVPILCFAESSTIYVHQQGQYTYHNGGAHNSSRIPVGSGWTSSAGKFNRNYKNYADIHSTKSYVIRSKKSKDRIVDYIFRGLGFLAGMLNSHFELFGFFEGMIFFTLLAVLLLFFLTKFTNFIDESDDEES